MLLLSLCQLYMFFLLVVQSLQKNELPCISILSYMLKRVSPGFGDIIKLKMFSNELVWHFLINANRLCVSSMLTTLT